MTLTAAERATLAAAQQITRKKNRERRMKIAAQRKPGGKADRGRVRDNGFRQYIRRQPCEAQHKGGCSGPVQHAHIRYHDARYANSAGAGVKNHDHWANPLCAKHHRIQGDVMGEKPFWAWVEKDPYETAAAHYAEYRGDVG